MMPSTYCVPVATLLRREYVEVYNVVQLRMVLCRPTSLLGLGADLPANLSKSATEFFVSFHFAM